MYLILPHFADTFGVSPLAMIVFAVPLSDILSVLVTTGLVTAEVKKLIALRRGDYSGHAVKEM
jgi:hypothetical protein